MIVSNESNDESLKRYSGHHSNEAMENKETNYTKYNNQYKERNNNMETMSSGIPFSIPFPGTENKQNDWMNNPFIYLVLLWLFGNNGFGGFGNRGFGGAAVGAAMEASNITASQVDDIRSKVSEVAAEVACGNRSLAGLQTACDSLGLQIGNLKDMTCAALNTIGRQIDQNGAAVVSKIQECCCATGERICNVEKEILRQGNAMTQGFANLGFLSEKNTSAITQTISSEACATRSLIQQLHNEDIVALKDSQIAQLNKSLADASLAAQTQTIINALKTTTTPAGA